MLGLGGAAVGEGTPAGLSLTASFSSWPGLRGSPRSAFTARVSSRASTSSQGARSCGEVGASGGRVASGAEGVGKMGRLFSPPPRPPQTQPPPAPLGHGNCGPAHHARLRPSTPPAGGVTAALANQRSRGGRARRA